MTARERMTMTMRMIDALEDEGWGDVMSHAAYRLCVQMLRRADAVGDLRAPLSIPRSTIMGWLRVSNKTAWRVTKELADLGLIEIEPGREKTSGNVGQAAIYKLQIDAIGDPCHPRHGSEADPCHARHGNEADPCHPRHVIDPSRDLPDPTSEGDGENRDVVGEPLLHRVQSYATKFNPALMSDMDADFAAAVRACEEAGASFDAIKEAIDKTVASESARRPNGRVPIGSLHFLALPLNTLATRLSHPDAAQPVDNARTEQFADLRSVVGGWTQTTLEGIGADLRRANLAEFVLKDDKALRFTAGTVTKNGVLGGSFESALIDIRRALTSKTDDITTPPRTPRSMPEEPPAGGYVRIVVSEDDRTTAMLDPLLAKSADGDSEKSAKPAENNISGVTPKDGNRVPTAAPLAPADALKRLLDEGMLTAEDAAAMKEAGG